MGRKSRGEKPSVNVLRILLTEAERKELDKAAKGHDGTSTWARDVLLRSARRKVK